MPRRARPESSLSSYRKLILWWALGFLSIGWIVFYINTGTKNSSAVLWPPLILFSALSAVTFLLLLVLFWRHNQSVYKRLYSQWERSFLCQRCPLGPCGPRNLMKVVSLTALF